MSNKYGVDTDYFKRELTSLIKSLPNRPPEELWRYLMVLAKIVEPNEIKETLSHDEGAYGQCGKCKRYSTNPKCLSDGYICKCGVRNYYSGSFIKPNKESIWEK